MKKLFLAAAAVSAFVAAPAMAEPARYIQGNIGGVVGGAFDFKIDNGGIYDHANHDADGGVYASVAVGQALSPKWTIEGELVYVDADLELERTYNVSRTIIAPLEMVPNKFGMTAYGVLLNANYELYRGDKYAVYVGAGAGYGKVDYDVKSYSLNDSTDDTGVMWQIKAGVTRELTANTAVDVSYRYLNGAEFGAVDQAPSFQNLTVGLRYNF